MKDVSKDTTENTPAVTDAVEVTYDHKDLLEQIECEHKLGKKFIQPKWNAWRSRLALYNNQKKDIKAIGDVTLFTVFQTVLAQLYSDQLNVSFNPRGDGDEDRAETWTQLAEFDYGEMEREETDYEWTWDSMFFGHGLQLLMEFHSESKTPIGEVIDPLTFIRDPEAKSTQGSGPKMKGAMRFAGWHGKLSKFEFDANKTTLYKEAKIDPFGDEKIGDAKLDQEIEDNQRARNEAQGQGDVISYKDDLKGDNQSISIVNWFTRYNGKIVYCVSTTDFKHMLRVKELPFKTIPIVGRKLFPTAHDFDGVSIPDLIEDKQRARAVLANASLQSVEFNLHNTYFYDESKITNKSDLNREMNKHVGIKGDPRNAVFPAQRGSIGGEVQWIMGLLSSSANASVATPPQEQGMAGDRKNTATNDVIVDKNIDTRRSLTARVFGWSEKKFWKQWYAMYNEYFDETVDSKVVRITGAFGSSFKEIRMADLKTSQHPDITIESSEVSDAKRFNKLQSHTSYLQMLANDPNSNMRYGLRRAGELRGMKSDEIDRLLPPTIDELEAEDENKDLSENKRVNIDVSEDHRIHLEIHAKAKDSKATRAHILAHQRALMIQRDKPDIFGIDAEEQSALNPANVQEAELVEQRPTDTRPSPFINQG